METLLDHARHAGRTVVLGACIRRAHASSIDGYVATLKAICATVPHKSGQFDD
ncbi:hypothetical protein [Caballeronia sp. Lep1P3]|uniref:hypothetical protein n=1 Tax=Caballeronia sp. Lep1P3 TaxID=2878150 RepID=UPI001FD46A89|nr:hypothetical protein [Caballeronia sp. Lep1P3]